MNFANFPAWHLLLILPLIAVALHFFFEHRQKMMSRFIEGHLQDEIAQGFSKRHYRIKAVLLMAAFVLMVLGLCRPQWGYTERPVKRHGLDIMVIIDVSKSMLTRDVLPSRLERTKLAVKDLVMKLNGSDHIGLIAFAGNAMVMCPLTYDYNGFLLSLDDLGTDTVPRGGTDISQAIDEAIKAYHGMMDSDKAVVLVTDGEDEEGDALQAARRARAHGVKIFTVGVGTSEGDLIQVADADGQMSFMKDRDGNVVKSHLNENLLQQIAYITGGAYIRSGATHFGLDYLYDRQLSRLKKHDAEIKVTRIYDERFQWPLTLAFILILVEALFLNGKKKTLDPRLKHSGVTALLVIIMFLPTLSFASVAGEVNKANDLYKHGEFDDSLKLYQEALDKDQDSPVINYDLGTAFYKKGDYDKALGYLNQAVQDKNINIQPKAEYNLGNVLYKSGMQKVKTNVDGAIKSLQDALGHYDQAVAIDPKDQDALYNEDYVKKVIERLKQIKQQQQQQQQQNRDQKQQQNQQQQQQNQQGQQGQQKQGQEQNQQNQQAQQAKQQKQQNQQAQQEQQEQKRQHEQQQQTGAQEQKQENAQGQAQADQKQIERQQAQDRLEEYQENEEPKKLLNYMPKQIDDRPVLKDW